MAIELLTQEWIDETRARNQETINFIDRNGEEEVGWRSLAVARANQEAMDNCQKILDNNGLMKFDEYVKDADGNIKHFMYGFKWGKPWIKINGKYFNGKPDQEVDDMLAELNLTRITVSVPAWYRLDGDKIGHAWVRLYIAPVNHVTGEKNPYWEEVA